MTVFLIRHGLTRGNRERRYVGASDEPLCGEGRTALAEVCPPEADWLYVSPMRRCRETAELLYPGVEQVVVDGLRETDFGAFEGHTYEELKDDPAYWAWLSSAGETAPPGGEGKKAVRERVVSAFLDVVRRHGDGDRVALVVHGGTIMTLLEAFEDGHRFYDWQVPGGCGWKCRWQEGRFVDVEKWR